MAAPPAPTVKSTTTPVRPAAGTPPPPSSAPPAVDEADDYQPDNTVTKEPFDPLATKATTQIMTAPPAVPTRGL